MAVGLFYIVLNLLGISSEPAKLGEADATEIYIVNMSKFGIHKIFFVIKKLKTSQRCTSLRLCPTNLT